MNKFNEKVQQLKEQAEDHKSKYFELKSIYDKKSQELTDKEYEITSLINKNHFLQATIDKHTSKLDETSKGLKENLTKISNHELKINQLVSDIENLETKYDTLSEDYSQIVEELREVHQLIQGV